MKRKIFFIMLFFFSFTMGGKYLFAQERHQQGKEERQKRWDKIEELRRIKMLEELNLSEDESLKFYNQYIAFKKTMRQVEDERMSNLDEMEKLLKSNNTNDLIKKLDYIESIDQKFFEARKNFFNDIRKTLSVEKVSKYFIFERNFQRELQALLKDFTKNRPKEKK